MAAQSSGKISWWNDPISTDRLRLTVADRSCIIVPLVVYWRTTNGHGSYVQMSLDWSCNWKIGIATYRTTPRSVVQLLTTIADWLQNLTFVFITNLARIKNYLKNSLLHASGVLHYLTWSLYIHCTCSYGGTSATIKTRYNIDSTTDAATGYYCWNVSQTTKTSSTKKRRQLWVHLYSLRATFQLMFLRTIAFLSNGYSTGRMSCRG
jgi:hypothetical protein